MLFWSRSLCWELPQRVTVCRVGLPYWRMSSMLKFPVTGPVHTGLVSWPPGPVFRHVTPALNPWYSPKGWMLPKPTPTVRASALAAVVRVFRSSTRPKNVGYVCCGMCTRTWVYDESKEMHCVEVVTASFLVSVQVLHGNAPSGRFVTARLCALATATLAFGRSCAAPSAAASAEFWTCRPFMRVYPRSTTSAANPSITVIASTVSTSTAPVSCSDRGLDSSSARRDRHISTGSPTPRMPGTRAAAPCASPPCSPGSSRRGTERATR